MISENDKKQYKNTKAPSGLKERIANDIQMLENEQDKRSNTMFGSNASPKPLTPDSSRLTKKAIQVVAACLLVVFFIGFVAMGMSSSVVYVDDAVYFGEKITVKEPVQTASLQRTAKSQKIEIDANIETEISISKGEFTLLDAQTLEHIYSGNKYSVTGKVIIQISLNEGEKAVLTLENILSGREISVENSN